MILKLFRILLVLALTFGGVAAFSYYWAENYYNSPINLMADKTVIVKKGSNTTQIAGLLSEAGVIKYPKIFTEIAKIKKQTHPKFGEYLFPRNISPKEILEKLEKGDVVIRKITIPEGKTTFDIMEILKQTPGLEGQPPEGIPEGSLMPTTYRYQWGDSFNDVISGMQKEMAKTMADLWAKRNPNIIITTPEQALILASIVEKETGADGERGLVASVFSNRLKKGMKLESDPTAVYGITKGAPLGRMPSSEDMHSNTEYNTYVIPALPPTPICNPGKAAIEAVLNPPETEYLFFVANGKGGHNFGKTLAEHNANIQLYREALKNN